MQTPSNDAILIFTQDLQAVDKGGSKAVNTQEVV